MIRWKNVWGIFYSIRQQSWPIFGIQCLFLNGPMSEERHLHLYSAICTFSSGMHWDVNFHSKIVQTTTLKLYLGKRVTRSSVAVHISPKLCTLRIQCFNYFFLYRCNSTLITFVNYVRIKVLHSNCSLFSQIFHCYIVSLSQTSFQILLTCYILCIM